MSSLLSYAGWYFLPSLVASWVQSFYYSVTIRAGEPKPTPGSPRYLRHRRNIQIGVIAVYLLYTIYEADWSLQRSGDFYQDLGLTPDVDVKAINSKFRKLTLIHHPDKVHGDAKAEAEQYYVHINQARETLIDPVKRFAYDRFGPEILEYKHCKTIGDYVKTGAMRIAPSYAALGFLLLVSNFLGYLEAGRYWRYFTFAAMLAFEAYTITRPTGPAIATRVLNPLFQTFNLHAPYLPFQILALARRTAIAIYIALSQIQPLIALTFINRSGSMASEQQVQTQLNRLDALTRSYDLETSRLLTLEMAPFAEDADRQRLVREQLKEWLVQNTIRSDPEVRDAMGRVLKRKREGVPAGAKGTRSLRSQSTS
ncbi:membrane associated DnaJ chaperone-like protein [Eremomyces bilateralis CBS 781.70]|uniref:Membrane associated DnaJ chaperone-like protein n=1 Tax=Eremomyces bilateralis CBS 781.70 TaxID=1392243 RepID=A0A6G1G7L8_9PEZI|nr:membrane associated DnaJ chaperone-like protein [Eremomyces bilateralis CBS 781.70]KAF1813880.1 membrane associated DnaJ chaperone-like protein [Eremomyces bilateralis CBS 781.70]